MRNGMTAVILDFADERFGSLDRRRIAQLDACAFLGKPPNDGGADSARASGDESDLACELLHAVSLRSISVTAQPRSVETSQRSKSASVFVSFSAARGASRSRSKAHDSWRPSVEVSRR
jgi:hypothetical protein